MTACDRCAAPCCHSYHVGIDGWDAFRLGRELSLPLSTFVLLRARREADHEFRVLLDASVPEEQRRYHCLTLGSVVDGATEFENRCVFLMTLGGLGRCGVYGIRPGVCRVYPTVARNGIIGTDGGGRFCPPRAWQAATVDVEAFRRCWVDHRMQRFLHYEVVDGWNERLLARGERRAEDEFLAFLVRVFAELHRRAPALFVDASGWTGEQARLLLDGVLREMGWRTGETERSINRLLGWAPHLPVTVEADESTELVLDPDRDIDPVGSALLGRLRR